MKYLKYIILLLCLTACKEEKPAPINSKIFTSILIDIHTMDGYSVSVDGRRGEKEKLRLDLAKTVFSKYNIDKATFDSCIQYYSHNIEQYAKIYDVVVDSLNRRNSKIEIILAANRKRDTMNIWTGKDSLSFRDDSLGVYMHKELFKEKGVYRLSLEVKIDEKDRGVNNRLVAQALTEVDTIVFDTILIKKDTSWQSCTLEKTIDSLECKSLVFRMMDCDNLDSLKQRFVLIRNIRLVNPLSPIQEDSKSVELGIKPVLQKNIKRKLSNPFDLKVRENKTSKEPHFSKTVKARKKLDVIYRVPERQLKKTVNPKGKEAKKIQLKKLQTKQIMKEVQFSKLK